MSKKPFTRNLLEGKSNGWQRRSPTESPRKLNDVSPTLAMSKDDKQQVCQSPLVTHISHLSYWWFVLPKAGSFFRQGAYKKIKWKNFNTAIAISKERFLLESLGKASAKTFWSASCSHKWSDRQRLPENCSTACLLCKRGWDDTCSSELVWHQWLTKTLTIQ